MGASLEWFAAIAAELGVSRPALYNHIEDREDLQFKCYKRTCDKLNETLDSASAASSDPLVILEDFLERTNQDTGPELAVLREIDALTDARRIQIRAELDAFALRLADILRLGISTGAFRPMDTKIVAHAFISMAGWLSIYRRWTLDAPPPHPTRGPKELLFRGLASDRRASMVKAPRLASKPAVMIDIFDRHTVEEARREAILAAASGLFNRRGIGATRVEDVSAAVGLSKRAMFHHISSKGALVDACLARATAHHLALMAAAEASPAPRIEALFSAVRDYVESVCDPERSFLVADVGAGLVSQGGWLAMANHHQRLLDGYQKILSDGQREGSIRALSLGDIQPCLPSLFHWVSGLVLRRESERRQVADELATLAVRGIVQ